MKNPVVANWVRFKRIAEDEYEIINLLHDDTYMCDAYTAWFIKQLDGKTNPYEIDKAKSKVDIDLLLDDLELEDIIRDKRFLSKSILSLLVTVWHPKITPVFRFISFIINWLLLLSFLPVLLFSLIYFLYYSHGVGFDYIITGSLVGLVFGMVLHEFGHMFSCLAYGGKVFEVGVALHYLIPGAYVLMNDSNLKKRMQRIQISAAGIEMNLLLTAICLILSAKFYYLSGFFLGAAIQNAFLALFNMTFINGFDGMNIMSQLLGVEDFVGKAKRVTKSRLKKKKLKEAGVSGKATIVVCYAIRVVQLALPLLLLLNVVGVASCFL